VDNKRKQSRCVNHRERICELFLSDFCLFIRTGRSGF